MPFILALDQGTTSSRAIVFDREAAVVAVAQKEFPQLYPRPGWVEHDPLDIWATQLEVAVEAMVRARIGPRDLAAIGVANQRETTLVWDRRNGEPVCNAIVWQDRRVADLMTRLKNDGHEPLIRRKTGLVADAYFSAGKIAWILDNTRDGRARAEDGHLAFGTVDSWLLYKLTAGRVFATDASNAARTLLYNIHTREWDDELLALFRIPRAMLPEVRDSSEVYAETDISMAIPGVPVAGVVGDQQAALVGQLCVRPGMAKNTYGTGCFLLMNTGDAPVESSHQLLSTVGWTRGREVRYALEGSVFVAGAVVQWLRDGLGLIRQSPEIEALAASVPDNGGVVFVPAFTGLGAPHWDPHARGTICGLSRGVTAGHLARAALEAIAFQVADLHDAMRADAGFAISELRVDGGAAANNLLMQIQADLLQVPLVRPTSTETTALGAALLAGLAVGYWKDLDELGALWRVDRRFEPKMPPAQAASLRAQWAEAVRRAKNWEPARP